MKNDYDKYVTSTSKSYNIPRQDAITKGAFSGYPKLDCLDLVFLAHTAYTAFTASLTLKIFA